MKTVIELQKEQTEYENRTGGALALREADDVYNNFNREQIKAYQREHGAAYLGKMNYYDDTGRAEIAAGALSPFTEYTGQLVYNFGADYCISAPDAELTELIRKWNTDGNGSIYKLISAITTRINDIGGIMFIWY